MLLKHVSQEAMFMNSIPTVPISVDTAMYLGNRHDYTKMHGQYPYIAMSLDSYVPLI